MSKTINATIEITEDMHHRVSFTITTSAGDVAHASNMSIGKACQEIGAVLYEADWL